MEQPNRKLFCLRALVAAVVGFAGLVVQVVWTRYAISFFGTSATTIASVLAISLCGLALGAWWASRFQGASTPQRRADRWAGLFLLLAAVSSLVAMWVASSVEDWGLSGSIANQFLINGLAVGVLNFSLGAIVPLIIAATGSQKASWVSWLYAAETFGGGAGALFAGFYSIQNAGLSNTLLIAAASLGGIGLLWLFLGRSVGSGSQAVSRDESISESGVATQSGSGWIMLAVLLAGCASLGLEIVWQRLLVLILGTDTHSYTVVAVGYLVGLGLGAAMSSIWLRLQTDRPDRSRFLFVCLQLLVAISSIVVLISFCYLASGPGQTWLSEPLWGEPAPVLKRFLFCTGLLLVPTTLIGASFPIAVHAIQSQGQTLSSRMGRLYACASIGNVMGILLAGFAFIPLLGLQATVVGYGLVSLIAAGLAMLQRYSVGDTAAPGSRSAWVLPIGLAIAAGVLGGYHVYEMGPVGIGDQDALRWYREGPVNTVAVLQNQQFPDQRKMVVDGIIIGQSGGGVEEKQHVLAHLPFLLQHQPAKHKVLTIGLGSGLLAGEVAGFSNVESVVAVELSPAVIEGATYFSDLVDAAATQRIKVVQGDGIQYLRTSSESFDAIISDGKSRPGHAGNVAFFSRDYYQYAAQRLADSGIFVQWYSLEGSTGEFQTVLSSFADTFPHGYVALAPADSVYLVGSREPLNPSTESLQDYLQRAESASLRSHHWSTVDDLRSMSWLRAKDVASYLPDAIQPNTIRVPVLEQFALDIHRHSATANKISNLEFLESLLSGDSEIQRGLFAEDPLRNSESIDRATLAMIRSAKISLQTERNWLDRSAGEFAIALKALPGLSRGGKLAESYLVAAESFQNMGDVGGAVSSFRRAAKLNPNDAKLQHSAGVELDRAGKYELAMALYYQAAAVDKTNAQYHTSFGVSLIRIGKHDRARQSFLKAIELDSEYARAHMGLGVVESKRGNPSAAQGHFLKASMLDPTLTNLFAQ